MTAEKVLCHVIKILHDYLFKITCYIILKVMTTYLGLLDLADGRAPTIFKGMMEFMTEHRLDIHKMVGLGSDGAAVMVGRNNGVSNFI
jgi:hypothetical protein